MAEAARILLSKSGDLKAYFHKTRKDVEIWRGSRYITSMSKEQYNAIFKKILEK